MRVGIVVARERIGDPWREHAWHAVSAFLHAPEISDWRELHRSESIVHYHAATLELELHAKETAGYLATLAGVPPSIYVVMREDPYGNWPYRPYHATLSAYEAQAYGGIDGETVETVAMPDALVELLRAFVEAHHVEEAFVKRQRKPHADKETRSFGQPPPARPGRPLRHQRGGKASDADE